MQNTNHNNLKKRAVTGMIWTALQKYSTMIIQFISGIILARLLTPYDYGCIGMLTIFMVLAQCFIDGGFDSALIQKKRPTREDYSTIFFWNMGMAVLLYTILYISAPYIAKFYNIPLLCDVLRVQGIILFIYAFNIVQRNQLRKNLNFKFLSKVTIFTSVISLTVTIIMAYLGYGVWSLVTQYILMSLIPAIIFWFYIKWRPIWTFSFQSFKELFGFGVYMFFGHLLSNFTHQLRGLLIGKFYNASIMGYYSRAYGTESMASQSISQVLNQVTFPLYAEVQDDKILLGRMVKRLSTSIAFFTFPLMFMLILAAEPLFLFLYSEKWLPSVPYFQILCLVGIGVCLQAVNLQTISAIGKSRIMFIWSVVKQVTGLLFVVVGLLLGGMEGLLWGAVLHSWNCAFINMYLVSKYIGYRLMDQLSDLFPVVIATILAFVVGYLFGLLTMSSMLATFFVKLFSFLAVYIGWAILFKPDSFVFVKDYFFTKIYKRNK